jgi:hypothetical protein
MAAWLWVAALAASPSEVVNRATPPSRSSPEDIRVPGEKGGELPHLVFASDQSTGELESMLSEPGVVADLINLRAGIALALPDLTVERASLVRQLNRDGIPVTAWLTLPTEQGYYLNAGNGRQAEVRFDDFEKWTTANGLRWAAIGQTSVSASQNATAAFVAQWCGAGDHVVMRFLHEGICSTLSAVVSRRSRVLANKFGTDILIQADDPMKAARVSMSGNWDLRLRAREKIWWTCMARTSICSSSAALIWEDRFWKLRSRTLRKPEQIW